MLPLVLNPATFRIGLAGNGEAFRRRLSFLKESGVDDPALFESRVPAGGEISALHILFVAGLDVAAAGALARSAREKRVLVNVEDRPELCDFHVPAVVRRGDLLLTVSTNGRSPGAARIVRGRLERIFGPEWGDRLEEIARARTAWRASGSTAGEIAERTTSLVEVKGWLS